MCVRARLSSDVSEIKLVFGIPPERPTPNIGAKLEPGADRSGAGRALRRQRRRSFHTARCRASRNSPAHATATYSRSHGIKRFKLQILRSRYKLRYWPFARTFCSNRYHQTLRCYALADNVLLSCEVDKFAAPHGSLYCRGLRHR